MKNVQFIIVVIVLENILSEMFSLQMLILNMKKNKNLSLLKLRKKGQNKIK